MKVHRLSLVLVVFMLWWTPAHATIMSFVSDLISTSAPNASATHRIRFTVVDAVPALGTITITPQEGAFELPAGFDYTDVDFAVWNGSSYVDRALASVPSATEDGVSVVTGSASSITITLSSSAGIAAGDSIEIRLGTNATYGTSGTVSPTNPAVNISYRTTIQTATSAAVPIDIAWTMIAIVSPVTLSVPLENVAPTLTGGLPSGQIAANNSVIEVTFSTDRTATCRYSTTAGVAYASMVNDFSTTQGLFFYTIISGHQNNNSYTYYVKCRGVQGAISDDYPISFSLKPTPISNTSVTEEGGTSGSGPFPGGSNTLYQATVMLSGFTSPGSTVNVLKDGKQAISTQAGFNGAFQIVLPNLERGTYTISVFSLDSKGRKSATYSSTLSVAAATNNAVSGILLPPVTTLEKDSVAIGEQVNISGTAAPGATIELSLIPKAGSSASTKQYLASTTASGAWGVAIDGRALSGGTWIAKAKAKYATLQSDFGTPAFLGVGQSASPNLSNRSDINADGKVNLVDFSIMLSFWNTDNASADLNDDSIVNLADFSILLFNWTG